MARPVPSPIILHPQETARAEASTLNGVASGAHTPSPGFLSPALTQLSGGRPRSSTVSSSVDGGDDSSDDSVLSWWSSDEDDDSDVDEEKEAERKRREAERQEILSQAGLQLRREPPGVPLKKAERKVSRRRPAPAAPKQPRRHAPPVPLEHRTSAADRSDLDGGASGGDVSPGATESGPEHEPEPELQTQDAYARYEQFLAQSRARPARSRADSYQRPLSQSMSPQPSAISLPAGAAVPPSPAPSTSQFSVSSQSGAAGSHHGKEGGKFSSFLSRMMAPSASHDSKTRVSISGPITRVTPAPNAESEPSPGADGAHEAESDFGKTWSSLVEPSVLETMSARERKRQEAIFEFIATEGAYNRDLQLMVGVFYASMLNILDEKALTVIFANIEDILLFNTGFLSSLEDRQKACRLYVDQVGDILDSFAPNMSVYRTYCVNQSQAGKLLQSLRSSTPALQAELQNIRETNPDVRGLDLSSFLLIPSRSSSGFSRSGVPGLTWQCNESLGTLCSLSRSRTTPSRIRTSHRSKSHSQRSRASQVASTSRCAKPRVMTAFES